MDETFRLDSKNLDVGLKLCHGIVALVARNGIDGKLGETGITACDEPCNPRGNRSPSPTGNMLETALVIQVDALTLVGHPEYFS